jgi:hypothetical protein
MTHPIATGVVIAIVSLLLVLYVMTAGKRKKKKIDVPEGFDAQMAFLDRIVAEQRAKQKDATPLRPKRTMKPNPTPVPIEEPAFDL